MSAKINTENAHRVVARNAAYLVAGQITAAALGLVLSAVLGRTLGAGDFGLYFLIISFSSFAFVLIEWGQQLYLIRELARYPSRTGVLFGTTLLLRVIGAALLVLPFGLAAWLLGYDKTTTYYIIAIFGLALPFCLAQAYGLVFRSRDRMDLDSALLVFNRCAFLGFAVLALVAGGRLEGVLAAQGMAGIVTLLLAMQFYRRTVGAPLSCTSASARRVFEGGSVFVPIIAVSNVLPYIDAVLLAKLTAPDVIGWYGAAKNISNSIYTPALIFGMAFYPRLVRVAANVRSIEADAQPALRPFAWLGALAATGTFLIADEAIAVVYGEAQFAPAGTVLKCFAPAFLLLFTDVIFGYVLLARGRGVQLAVLKVVSVVVATVVGMILIPVFQRSTGNGAIGLAVAFGASELVVWTGQFYMLWREGIRLRVTLDMARALAAAAITILVFWWLPPLPIYMGIPLCVSIFLICSLGLGLARPNDIRFFQTLVRKEDAGSGR